MTPFLPLPGLRAASASFGLVLDLGTSDRCLRRRSASGCCIGRSVSWMGTEALTQDRCLCARAARVDFQNKKLAGRFQKRRHLTGKLRDL